MGDGWRLGLAVSEPLEECGRETQAGLGSCVGRVPVNVQVTGEALDTGGSRVREPEAS